MPSKRVHIVRLFEEACSKSYHCNKIIDQFRQKSNDYKKEMEYGENNSSRDPSLRGAIGNEQRSLC